MGFETGVANIISKLIQLSPLSSFEPRLENVESRQVACVINSIRLYTVLINNLSASTLSEASISPLVR